MQRRHFKFLILGLCLANLLVFARFYVADYLPSVNLLKVPDAVYFILYYPVKFIEFSLTPLSAVAVFSLFYSDVKKLLLSAALLSLPRAIYLLPYYYLYENAYGNDSLESITLSFFITVFGIIVLFIHITALTFILRFAVLSLTKRGLGKENPYLAKKENRALLSSEAFSKLPSELSKKGFFDISVPIVFGIFAVSFIEFLYPLISEIVRTASFFAKYGSSYTTGEIFTIVFAFIFVLAELIGLHTVGILLKNLLSGAKKATFCQQSE